MFGFKSNKIEKLIEEKEILEKDIKHKEEEKKRLREELAEIKLDKKMSEEDIKHMVKMKTEQKDIELQKEKLKLQEAHEKTIAEVKDVYRDKIEKYLEVQVERMESMYKEVLNRLPNVNMEITRKR